MNPRDVRQGLRVAGYVPLPLRGKQAMLEKWTKVKVDEAEVDRWSRELDYLPDTGVRTDGIVAVDIDVLDPVMASECFRLAKLMLGDTPLKRVGQAPKMILVYKAGKHCTPKKTSTGKYLDDSDRDHGVEVLRGKKYQFAAFGIHPKTNKAYEWGHATPLTVPRRDLPSVSDSKLRDYLDECHKLFQNAQWAPKVREGQSIEDEFTRVYDLEDKSEVHIVSDGYAGMWDVVDLEEALRELDEEVGTTSLRCTLEGFRDGADGNNGNVGLCPDGFLRVSDYVDRTVHLRPKVDRMDDIDENAKRELVGEGDSWAAELQERWAYVAQEHKAFRLDDPTSEGYTRPALVTLTRKVEYRDELVVNYWLDQDKKTHRCDARRFSPRHVGTRVFRDGSQTLLNTYCPPIWKNVSGDPDGLRVWNEFLEHLIPAASERAIFLDWLANKVQRPWERMFGVLMVADGIFGTGRGSLFGVIGKLMGDAYTYNVPFEIFAGTSHQAQYYDWLVGSLMVCVGESLEEETVDWHRRRSAFERIKQVIEPGNGSTMYLPRKQVKAAVGDVYSSIILATNHSGGVAIERGDRRVCVLANGEKMGEPMRRALHGHMGSTGLLSDDAKLAAVWQDLYRRKIQTDLFDAPMTAAKEALLEGQVTDLEDAYRRFIEEIDPKIFTTEQFERYCAILTYSEDVQLPAGDELRNKVKGRFFRSRGCKSERGQRVLYDSPYRETPRRVRYVIPEGLKDPGSTKARRAALEAVEVSLSEAASSRGMSVQG